MWSLVLGILSQTSKVTYELEFVLLESAKLGMGTAREEKGEGSRTLEDSVLGGEFSIPFICDHRKLANIRGNSAGEICVQGLFGGR